MPRKPRVHVDGAFYHVMLRGNGGDNIFFDYEDREKFLELMIECVNRFTCRIHAFCLMTNHVHLALQVSEINLSKIIQNISFRYTRIMNKKRNKIGHLFQGRFKAIMIDADNYLLSLVKYIHLNPVRAKIVKNPEKYLWSSHRFYLNTSLQWLTTSTVLSYFSNKNSLALKLYTEFIGEASHHIDPDFEKPNQMTFPVICDDIFMKKLEVLQVNQKNKTDIKFEEIIKYVCKFHYIDESQLHKKSRERTHAKVRARIAWLAIEFNVSNTTKVAAYFNRHHSTICRVLSQISSSEERILASLKEYIKKAHTQA